MLVPLFCWGTQSALPFLHGVFYARVMELLSHDELTRLSPVERLAMISQLWDSLDNEHVPLSAAQQEEIDRRLATVEADRDEGSTWEALRAALESRCP